MSLLYAGRRLLFTSMLFLVSSIVHAQTIQLRHYDEIYDEHGEVRPEYGEIMRIRSGISEKRIEEIRKTTAQSLSGDNSVTSLPRLIAKEEYDSILKKGVDQRGRALIAFVEDHHSGKKTYLKNPKLINAQNLKSIMERYNEANIELNPDFISIPYGPDIMRDENGNWRVIEDSIGSLGGVGDITANSRALLNQIPEYQSLIDPGAMKKFYKDRTEHMRKNLFPTDGVAVSVLLPHQGDHEDERLAPLYKEDRITVNASQLQFVQVSGDAAYVQVAEKNGQKNWIKIGYLDVNSEYQYLQNPALTKLVASGKLASNYSPGTDFLNDKELYIYVEDFIRHYLHEEPLLRNIPTRRLSSATDPKKLDEPFFQELKANPKKYVLKDVNNRGGKGVFVGRKDLVEFNKALEIAAKNPEKYIVQEYMPLPVVGNEIVDFRIHSIISTEDSVVSDFPWGRTIEMNGNGKVNLSGTGAAQVVWVSPNIKKTTATPPPAVTEAMTAALLRKSLSRKDAFHVSAYLQRLFSSANNGILEVIQHLHTAKVLDLLASAGVKMPLPQDAAATLITEAKSFASRLHFTPEEAISLGEIFFSQNENLLTSYLKAIAPSISSAEEWVNWLNRISTGRFQTPETKMAALRTAMNDFDRWLESGLTPEQQNQLKKRLAEISSAPGGEAAVFVTASVKLATSPAEYMEALIRKSSVGVRNAVVLETYSFFFRTSPSLAETLQLQSIIVGDMTVYQRFTEAALARSSSAGDFLQLLETKDPSKKAVAQRIFRANEEKFRGLNPSREQNDIAMSRYYTAFERLWKECSYYLKRGSR